MPDQAAFKAIVTGKVQRVFFRISTREQALSLNLTGTVRNLPGGISVEVVAEGGKADLETLAEYLKTGPPRARVDSLDIEWGRYTGSYDEFTVIG